MSTPRTPANIALLTAIILLSASALILRADAQSKDQTTHWATEAWNEQTAGLVSGPPVTADVAALRIDEVQNPASGWSALPADRPTTTTSTPTTSAPTTSVPTSEPATPPTKAQPTTTVETLAAQPLSKTDQALAMISYPWEERLPQWEIRFVDSESGPLGLTFTKTQVIEIYVRDHQPVDVLASVIAHEIGHAVDVTLNDGDERRQWQEARDITNEPWWPESGKTDFHTGAGDFAESFSVWQVGPNGFRSKIAPVPTEAQLQLIAELANN